jgi:hypothetical protein
MSVVEMKERVDRIVVGLRSRKINFLAIDFDLTIVNIHTGGKWSGTVEELASHIRGFFKYLIPAAILSGIHVAVVTFSPQVGIIAAVLRHAFPDQASKIPIRGNDGTWQYLGRGSPDGKQPYMASAAEELALRHSANITRDSTVLIDDDRNNIETALRHEVRAVWLNPEDPGDAVQKLETEVCH